MLAQPFNGTLLELQHAAKVSRRRLERSARDSCGVWQVVVV